jgi:DNA-binding GntR family transcriptional regulator
MTEVNASSRAAKIKSVVETEIESGVLSPGDPLDERSLAERFGVSRTPVREALQQLAAQNLVQIVPRQGVFVTRMSVTQIREMLELLAELEGVSAKFAARRISDAQRDALSAALAACQTAQDQADGRAFATANAKFHDVVYEASCNTYLADQIRTIRRLIGRYHPRIFGSTARREKSLQDHRALLDAVFAGDEDRAEALTLASAPVGGANFSEFLATLPARYLDEAATGD